MMAGLVYDLEWHWTYYSCYCDVDIRCLYMLGSQGGFGWGLNASTTLSNLPHELVVNVCSPGSVPLPWTHSLWVASSGLSVAGSRAVCSWLLRYWWEGPVYVALLGLRVHAWDLHFYAARCPRNQNCIECQLSYWSDLLVYYLRRLSTDRSLPGPFCGLYSWINWEKRARGELVTDVGRVNCQVCLLCKSRGDYHWSMTNSDKRGNFSYPRVNRHARSRTVLSWWSLWTYE